MDEIEPLKKPYFFEITHCIPLRQASHASVPIHEMPIGWVLDGLVSAPQTHVIQLETTIRSAHALLQAGLNHLC